MKITGGAAETICDADDLSGATWAADGTILMGHNKGPIRRVPASGGTPADLTSLDAARGETGHAAPVFLPDGEHFFYRVLAKEIANKGVFIGSVRGGAARRLPVELLSSQTPPPVRHGAGHLFYVAGDQLVARKFDVKNLAFDGSPIAITDGTANTASGSDDGTLVFVPRPGERNRKLVEVDRGGKQTRSFGPETGEYGHVDISPDGKRLAADFRDARTGRYHIWTIDLGRNLPEKLSAAQGAIPVWAGDGKSLFYESDKSREIYSVPAGGDAMPTKIGEAEMHHFHVSADGRFLLFSNSNGRIDAELWLLALDGTRQLKRVLPEGVLVSDPQFSPDGRWFAYHSSETGTPEVYVQSFPPGKGKWRISRKGGTTPRWRGDGRELYFLDLQKQLMAVRVTANAGGEFKAENPAPLFEFAFPGTSESTRYAVSPNGEFFYFTAPSNDRLPSLGLASIQVTLNWAPPAGR